MPQTALNNMGANYDWDAGDDGWKAGVDDNFVIFDAFCLGTVISELNAQPGGPALSDAYIIGDTPTGAAWTGNARALAVWNSAAAAWAVLTPVEGWAVYDRALRKFRVYDGVEWQIRDDVLNANAAAVTISRDHYGATIEQDTTAAARDVTIPQDVNDDLPIGFYFNVVNMSGANNVTFTLTGLTTRGIAAIAVDRASLRIVKSAADTWISS
jgi:hypothetical protein